MQTVGSPRDRVNSNRCERKTGVKPETLRRKMLRYRRQCRGSRDERGDEDHHQQRGLCQEPDHHLAPCAQSAEGRADVHRCERHEDARHGEKPHERDGIGDLREGQPRTHRGNDARGHYHGGKDDIGRQAKEPGGSSGDDGILVKELAYAAVRLPQARRTAVLEPRAALVDPTEKERRRGEGDDELEQLRDDLDRPHNTTARSTTSVTKL